jgi:carbamate kinase
MAAPRDPHRLVVALGGRALRAAGSSGGAEGWVRALSRTLPPLADVLAAGLRPVLVHGSGLPGEELAPPAPGRERVSTLAFDLERAESQGAAGYAVQQVLGNLCRNRNLDVPMAVVMTRVRVDPDDAAPGRLARPVGPRYTAAQARRLERERGWRFAGSAASRRRLVTSVLPREILDAAAIRRLVEAGIVVVAAGGGGVPVASTPLGHRGLEVLLEEDATAALLGTAIGADRLTFVTDVDHVEVGHGTRSIGIERLSIADARALLAAGEFPPASMGPKIEAAIEFVGAGGREAVITSLPRLRAALDGRAGTRIVP